MIRTRLDDSVLQRRGPLRTFRQRITARRLLVRIRPVPQAGLSAARVALAGLLVAGQSRSRVGLRPILGQCLLSRPPWPPEPLLDITADQAPDNLRRRRVFGRAQLLEHGLLVRIDQNRQSRGALFVRHGMAMLFTYDVHTMTI